MEIPIAKSATAAYGQTWKRKLVFMGVSFRSAGRGSFADGRYNRRYSQAGLLGHIGFQGERFLRREVVIRGGLGVAQKTRPLQIVGERSVLIFEIGAAKIRAQAAISSVFVARNSVACLARTAAVSEARAAMEQVLPH